MPDRDALTVPLDGGWQLIAGGITRERGGRLTGDIVLQNGVPVYTDRIALNLAGEQAAFAEAATAPDRPAAAVIVAALVKLVPDALELAQEPPGDGGAPKRSQADRLVGYAQESADALFTD